MIDSNIGDTLKIIGENRVIKVAGITVAETDTIPSGWIITNSGSFVNPRFCEHYKGAMSVLWGADD